LRVTPLCSLAGTVASTFFDDQADYCFGVLAILEYAVLIQNDAIVLKGFEHITLASEVVRISWTECADVGVGFRERLKQETTA
jgi:hypothetical protein